MDHELLVIEVAGRRFGAPLPVVQEIFSLGPLTPVPVAPATVAGVVNLRGQVVPVLDLPRILDLGLHRLRLGDPIVLAETGGVRVGLLVDRVVGLARPGETSADLARDAQELDVPTIVEDLRAMITPGPPATETASPS